MGGIGNDVIFTYLPIVDNFWHSQAAVMVSPRFPLYILCWYAGWLYIPFALVSRMKVARENKYVEAALVSLLSASFYFPWDVTGAKFVWWTWHTTDNSFQNRFLGVPCASSLFTLMIGYSWCIVLRTCLGKDFSENKASRMTCLAALIGSFLFSVPVMIILMNLVGVVGTGTLPPGPVSKTSVILVVIALLVFALLSYMYCTPTDRWPNSRVPSHISILEWGVRFHFAFLAVVCICGDPEHHISTGVHQPFGDCNMKEIDVSGLHRSLYTCRDDERKYFVQHSFNCADRHFVAVVPPSTRQNSEWYSVCGTDKSQSWLLQVLICIGFAGLFFEFLNYFFKDAETENFTGERKAKKN